MPLSKNFNLPAPARYFPLEKGVYEVAPGLKAFGSAAADSGNGALESKIFQFDSSFETFRQSKLSCRRENLAKYYLESEYSPEVSAAIARLIINRLLVESPDLFAFEEDSLATLATLECRLTGERLHFDSEMKLIQVDYPGDPVEPGYISTLDALALQVQEDLNAMTLDPASGRNWLSAIHVCSPSSWRPAEKVGRDFIGIHLPVPASEAMLRVSKALVTGMIQKGPYVRFVWGLTTNPKPNHHPDAPPGVTQEEWRGKPITAISDGTPVYMWVERQVAWGCPEAHASIFTIRASFTDLRQIRDNAGERELFISTYKSMAPAVREYKGLDEAFDAIMNWMGEPASTSPTTRTDSSIWNTSSPPTA